MQTTDPDKRSDFGAILARWEKTGNRNKAIADSIRSKDRETGGGSRSVSQKKLRTDDVLDLHGMTSDEAERTLKLFMARAAARKYKKVLIIHGKGIHSKEGPVMKKLVTDFLERCPKAGKHGTPSAAEGGSGATWVFIKN